jgi:ion channel-forming bestrophin family protein
MDNKTPQRIHKPHKLYTPHRPHALKWRGSIIPYVIIQTIIVTVITVIVAVLFETGTLDLSASKAAGTSTTFTTIIGIVVSLLLTYRTNTAYDRYFFVVMQ